MNSLLFILFCLIRLDPVWFLWKKKDGVVGELKETKDFMLKTKVLLYMFIQKHAFSIFLFLFANNPVFIEVNRLLFDEKWVCFFIVI